MNKLVIQPVLAVYQYNDQVSLIPVKDTLMSSALIQRLKSECLLIEGFLQSGVYTEG